MKINDVKHHVGVEATLRTGGKWTAPLRARIEGVETVTDKIKDSFTDEWVERKHRRVKVTILHPESGVEERTQLVEARYLNEPWAKYWDRGKERREQQAIVQAARERLEKALAKALPNSKISVRQAYRDYVALEAQASDMHDLAAVLESVNL